MIPKISQIAIVLTLISVTSQRESGRKIDPRHLYQALDLSKIVQHEVRNQLHSSAHRLPHKKDSDVPSTNLFNIQNLNYYNDPKSSLKEKLVQTLKDRSNEKDNHDDETRDEVQQILDELESELARVDHLRCSSDRCSESLRAGDDRCGCRPRSDDKDEDVRDEEKQDDDNRDNDDKSLRCQSDRCGRTRTRPDKILKSQLERYGKKYKINNELDAIVLDLGNTNGMVDNLNSNRNMKFNKVKQDRKLNVEDSGDKLDFVDAFIVDLDQVNDGDTIQNRYGDSSKSSYFDRLHGGEERYSSKKILNHVQDKKGDSNFLTYFSTQKMLPRNLKSQLQSFGSDEDQLKELLKSLFDHKTSHSNRGISKNHLTKRLQRLLENRRNNDERLMIKKTLFPLTVKQKLKFNGSKDIDKPLVTDSARKSGNQYGLPFELQVEGLGQVSL